jgi:hypothetical protein
MTEQELFDDLCAKVGIDVVAEDTAMDMKAGMPFIVTLLSGWFITQLRKLGCEQKELIMATVDKYVIAYIKNEYIANMIRVAVASAIMAMCPENMVV